MNSSLKTLSFFYTDIEGSTRLWDGQLEAMRIAIERHDLILRTAIESHSGRIFRTGGDAFCAVFNSTPAAVAAAADAQRALFAERWPTDSPLLVRIALHSGEVEEHGGDYVGSSLNRIGRLLAVCHGGQTLLTAATAALSRDYLPANTALLDLGQHRFRDLVHPENIFQLSIEGIPDSFPPLKSLDSAPNNLPVQLTSFIGRQRELADVGGMINRYHLVTLTGPGGTGKSRLMLQAGAAALDRFTDGVWVVELAPLTDPTLILPAIAAAFHLREFPGRSLEEVVMDFLRPKTSMLMLDNCEHLVEACAQIADSMLHTCPGLKILTSSREPLGIAGEGVFRVPSLSLPPATDLPGSDELRQYEAVHLFTERAEAVQPGFILSSQNAPSIVQVCRRLDGIPLAIELAAARCKLLSPAQIASRLDDRFRLLTGGSRTALPRQQTLEALISWSYDLLSEDEKTLFLRLSVFVGGFSLEAVESVSGVDALDLLEQLANKSLVQVEEPEGEIRYRLLENIRQYSRDRLLETGEVKTNRNLHLDYFSRFAQEANSQLTGPAQRAWAHRLGQEHDNLRAALDWALTNDPDTALELAGNLALFWRSWGYARDGIRSLNDALARVEALPPLEGDAAQKRQSARGQAYSGLGLVLVTQGDYRLAHEMLEKSVVIWRELGDKRGLAFSLGTLGNLANLRGLPFNTQNYAEEGLAISREVQDDIGIGLGLGAIGQKRIWQDGDFETARQFVQEGISKLRGSGNEWFAGIGVFSLGMIDLHQGNYQASRDHILESYLIFDGMGDRHFTNIARSGLAEIARAEKDYPQARRIYLDTIEEWRRLGNLGAVARCLECLAFNEGELAGQGSSAEQSVHINQAAKLLGAAETIRQVNGAIMPPDEQAEYDGQLKLIQSMAPVQTFKEAWQQGSSLELDVLLQGYK